MLILFDNGTPAPLRHALMDHVVVEAFERGWDRLLNGELIAAAEAAGFEVLLTTDKNICVTSKTGRAGKSRLSLSAISSGPFCAVTLNGLWRP